MSNHIFSDELTYRLKRPLTWIFALMLLIQGATYARSTYNLIVNDGVWVNAAGIFYVNISGVGFLLFIIVAIITGTVIYKDIGYGMAGIIYTKPVNEKQYFLKKFAAAFVINALLSLAYIVGIALTPWFGTSVNQLVGPTLFGQMAQAYLLFMLPNLFLLTGISISLVVLFKNMAASYIGLFMVMIVFLIAESTRESSPYLNIILLLDPFAYGITREVVDAMSVADKNSGYFPLNSILIINRAIWFSISFLLFIFSYYRFSFKSFIMASGKKEKQKQAPIEEAVKRVDIKRKSSRSLDFSGNTMIGKLFRLSWIEFIGLTRPANFKIVLGVIMTLFLCYHLLWSEKYYIETPQLPLTYLMTVARQPLGLYLILFFTVWSVELLFKDRTVGIWQVKDALPVPVWVTLVSRFMAMAWVAFVCSVCLLVIGLLVQLGRGFTDIDWTLYLKDLFWIRLGWINYIQIVAFAFFVGAVTNNRFAAHGIAVGIMLFEVVANITHTVEQLRFLYIFVPGLEDYSEMNGYGIFDVSAPWYGLMWCTLAIVFLLTSIGLWNRGTIKPLRVRLTSFGKRLSWPSKLLLVVCIAAFFALQSYIGTNVNKLNEFRTKEQDNAFKADYEKQFKWLEGRPQPKYTQLDLIVDIFPEQRQANYTAVARVSNLTNTAIDTLYFTVKDFTTVRSIHAAGRLLPVKTINAAHRLFSCSFPKALQPGDHLKIEIQATLKYKGFTQKDPQPDVVNNGTFLGRDIIPVIGYDTGKELLENREREKFGLNKLNSRMDPSTDTAAVAEIVQTPDATWLTGSIQISTSCNQIPVASGTLARRWQENGREFGLYTISVLTPFNWRMGSANYKIHPFKVHDSIQGNIYYHPNHLWNINHITEAGKNAVKYLQPYLGTYPYKTLQIAEIPFYNDEFYVSHSLIAIPEKHGWTVDLSRKNDEAYINYILVRELARQMIDQRIRVANVQGAGIFQYTIPDYYAIQYIRRKYGEKVYKDLIERKIRDYKKEKGSEPNNEPALIYSDGAEYVERDKGPVVFCRLNDMIGGDTLSGLLKLFFETCAKNRIPVTSNLLFEHLKNNLSPKFYPKLKTDIEDITTID
jgi:ABC-2 type transport system permease protein